MDSAALNDTVKQFLASHKHCDVLVNCAGMMGQGSPTEGMPAYMTVNLKRCCLHVLSVLSVVDA